LTILIITFAILKTLFEEYKFFLKGFKMIEIIKEFIILEMFQILEERKKRKKRKKKKKGLWANIHARRKAGKRPKRPGEEGYPKTLDI